MTTMQRDETLRRVAQLLWWVGLASLIGGLVTLFMKLQLVSGLLIGLGLVMLGGNTLIGRELVVGGIPRIFSVRQGAVVRGQVDVHAGWNNFTLGGGSKARIASMQYGPFGEPDFGVEDGIAYLRFKSSLRRPNLTAWQAELAGNVLWEIVARSSLGDLNFDLRDLRTDKATIQSGFGYITVKLPQRGFLEANVKSTFGRIIVEIPEETGTRIVIHRRGLTTLLVENDRLHEVAPDRLITPEYDMSPSQVDLRITCHAGEIIIR